MTSDPTRPAELTEEELRARAEAAAAEAADRRQRATRIEEGLWLVGAAGLVVGAGWFHIGAGFIMLGVCCFATLAWAELTKPRRPEAPESPRRRIRRGAPTSSAARRAG